MEKIYDSEDEVISSLSIYCWKPYEEKWERETFSDMGTLKKRNDKLYKLDVGLSPKTNYYIGYKSGAPMPDAIYKVEKQ